MINTIKKTIKLVTPKKDFAFHGLALLLSFNIASATILPESNAPENQALTIESAISNTSLAGARIEGKIQSRITATVTGYSSTEDQTDDTPFITASGARVADGIIATNFLPFNTRVKIPKLFGNKIFIVKDRMAKRFSDRVDIWFADRSAALKFGKRTAEIVIL